MDRSKLRERQWWSLEQKIDHSLFTIETFLSRVDGKAVLERKEKEKEPQGFKPGDILSLDILDNRILIYAGADEDNHVFAYAVYFPDENFFFLLKGDNEDFNCGYAEDFHYATDKQKAMLFAEIKKRGYVWDAEKLELRKREFKIGDFICFGDGYIGIHYSNDAHRGKFYTRCHLSGNKFVSHCEWHSEKKVCLATVEQRQRLLDAIDRNGFVWLPETLEMKKKYEFDDGAFVVDEDKNLFIHYKGGDTDYSHGSYIYWDRASDDITSGRNSNMTTGVRLATEDEVQSLLDRLAKDGYEWDSERKRLIKKRWRGEEGGGVLDCRLSWKS